MSPVKARLKHFPNVVERFNSDFLYIGRRRRRMLRVYNKFRNCPTSQMDGKVNSPSKVPKRVRINDFIVDLENKARVMYR